MRSGTRVQGNAKICCLGLVCFTQSGKAAHALHPDSKTALGPWITFASDATLDRALVYLGADPMRRWKITRQSMRAWGQSSTHIRLLQNRKTCSGSITASAEPACPFTRGCPRSPRWFFLRLGVRRGVGPVPNRPAEQLGRSSGVGKRNSRHWRRGTCALNNRGVVLREVFL